MIPIIEITQLFLIGIISSAKGLNTIEFIQHSFHEN